MYKERIPYLLKQYLDHLITEKELDELMLFLMDDDSSQIVQEALETLVGQTPELTLYQEEAWEPLYQKILERSGQAGGEFPAGIAVVPFFKRRSFLVAAAVFMLVTGSWLLWRPRNNPASPAGGAGVAKSETHDIAPGSDRAVLTLADGSTIHLDSAQNGLVGRQGDQQLIKSKDAQLAYHGGLNTSRPNNTGAAQQIQYNLLTTPRGGQYRLELPDGSKVWLNAATSLRYPVSFSGKERVVELKGEAYFEVAENAAMPFKVNVLRGEAADARPLQVEVLGTHFDIMGYEEEPVVNATLLEGAIRVQKEGASVLVKPGEQARLNRDGRLDVAPANIEEAVAWKDGMFRFNGAGIEQVMRQLSRWYDVEVVYVNGVPKDRFQGEMYRNVNASKILKVLEASGVHFTVEGKKILVKL